MIRLQPQHVIPTLPPTNDPDPLISCDLMDGRDAFLSLCREKHYEFSSLRRAKYSTMAMLYELHNQGQDRFVYTCNKCKRAVETRFHCTVCEASSIVMQICIFLAQLTVWTNELKQQHWHLSTIHYSTVVAQT